MIDFFWGLRADNTTRSCTHYQTAQNLAHFIKIFNNWSCYNILHCNSLFVLNCSTAVHSSWLRYRLSDWIKQHKNWLSALKYSKIACSSFNWSKFDYSILDCKIIDFVAFEYTEIVSMKHDCNKQLSMNKFGFNFLALTYIMD